MLGQVKLLIDSSIIIRAICILPKTDRLKIIAVTVLQAVLGFMDLIGVAAMGIVGALAVTGIQSKTPGSRISQILDLLGIESLSFQVLPGE